MTQEQLRADVATLRKVAESAARPEARAFLTRILAIVEPLAGLSDEQVRVLVWQARAISQLDAADAKAPRDKVQMMATAYAALARMLGGGQ